MSYWWPTLAVSSSCSSSSLLDGFSETDTQVRWPKNCGQRSHGHEMLQRVQICFCCVFYLNLLLYVVKDEPLRVDEVIWGVEGDGVEWSAVNAASIHRPTSRFWPHQPFDWRDKNLWGHKEMLVNLTMGILGVSSIHVYIYGLCYNPNCL